MAPLELYEKVYINPAFLESQHGGIACEQCHGGDPQDDNWRTAHAGLSADPTYPDPSLACGECHEDIVASTATSLHYTLNPMGRAIQQRVGVENHAVLITVDAAMENHCFTCHASCGQCRVSRPDYAGGGLLDAHRLVKTPAMDTTCVSCHGGRIHGEFTGANETYAPDVQYGDHDMICLDCHGASELHAAAQTISGRYDLPERPACLSCHPEAQAEQSTLRAHSVHQGKLACQVCHAQAGKSCFDCHVGRDLKGLPYYKCEETRMAFKIGMNPNPSKERPYDYIVIRHAPVVPWTFEAYIENALQHFDSLPTWKMDTPHNIQRITPQNRTCNSCHGNPRLFLSGFDLAPWENTANNRVIVPENRIPELIPKSNHGTAE